MTINIGDVVVVIGGKDMAQPTSYYSLCGKCGVVRCTDGIRLGIEFNESFPTSHNLSNQILSYRVWFVDPKHLMKMFPVKEVIKTFYELP